MNKLDKLNIRMEAVLFAQNFARENHSKLYGSTDGKTIGTYIEKAFFKHLKDSNYEFKKGYASRGLDFPELEIDIKVTSSKQPQSSSPYNSVRDKIYGLGYSLLVFEYDKKDIQSMQVAQIAMQDIKYIEDKNTGDKNLTTKINKILDDNNLVYTKLSQLLKDEFGKLLSMDDRHNLIEEIMDKPPEIGKIGLSMALQWRVRY